MKMPEAYFFGAVAPETPNNQPIRQTVPGRPSKAEAGFFGHVNPVPFPSLGDEGENDEPSFVPNIAVGGSTL